MDFALSLPPLPDHSDAVTAAQAAERAGLRSFWLYDMHRARPDPYPLLALVAASTKQIHFGVCVTNPVTRSPLVTAQMMLTLQRISGGRAALGIGRGDVPVKGMGCVPASLADLRAAIEQFRAEAFRVDACWRPAVPVPVYVGTYGPLGLRMAGQIADGVILQAAHPELLSWARDRVREGALAAGRDPAQIWLQCAAPLAVDLSDAQTVAETRWFARLIAPDIAAIALRNAEGLPGLVGWARRWHEGDAGGREAVADEMCTAFALAGSAESCRARLGEMERLGIDEMNMFSMGDWRRDLEAIARLRSMPSS